jgi:hypothetical protein
VRRGTRPTRWYIVRSCCTQKRVGRVSRVGRVGRLVRADRVGKVISVRRVVNIKKSYQIKDILNGGQALRAYAVRKESLDTT